MLYRYKHTHSCAHTQLESLCAVGCKLTRGHSSLCWLVVNYNLRLSPSLCLSWWAALFPFTKVQCCVFCKISKLVLFSFAPALLCSPDYHNKILHVCTTSCNNLI